MNCLRCNETLEYLKEYKFESQDSNRGLFDSLFDKEEHLVFKIYVCPKCKHSELFYSGTHKHFD